jgi:hypothetical protein
MTLHGQVLEDPDAIRIGLETDEGNCVLLSAVRMTGDRDGIEIWIPIEEADSAASPDAAVWRESSLEAWLLLHRLNYASRFTHDWRIVSGDESRPGLRRRLALDALEPEVLALAIDEGIDRAAQLRRVLGEWAAELEGFTEPSAPPVGVAMIRG